MVIKKNKGKVFVGLSGGVDSSVSAALLKEQGFDVVGVFIKVWQPDFWGGCTMKEDRLDAMRVCAKLNIPFLTLNLEREYKKEVVDYMIDEYRLGRTPNPDVMCNKFIKFGGFFDWAMKNGADYVATGHYARVESRMSKFYLLAGNDKSKDQTYFLWTLKQSHLAKTFFPIGNIEKIQVRKLAKKFGLFTAEKKDSQGLCFIGKIDMSDFLKHFLKTKSGDILNEKGEIIGRHDGVELYTLGQRHGFEIFKKTTFDGRYFIINKDFKRNSLIVSHNPIKIDDINNREIKLKNINWILGEEPDFNIEYLARIRYRQPLEKCFFVKDKNSSVFIKFNNIQKSPTPGQSVVFFLNKICLGGGIIE